MLITFYISDKVTEQEYGLQDKKSVWRILRIFVNALASNAYVII